MDGHETKNISWSTRRRQFPGKHDDSFGAYLTCPYVCIMTQPCGDLRPSKFHLPRKQRLLRVLPTLLPGVPTILTLLVIVRVAFLTLRKIINARKKDNGKGRIRWTLKSFSYDHRNYCTTSSILLCLLFETIFTHTHTREMCVFYTNTHRNVCFLKR